MPEEFETDVEETMEDEMVDDVEEMDAQTTIMDAVTEAFAEGGEAAGLSMDEAIDVVVAKLEGMRTMTTESPLGGLGGDAPFDLPEDED